MRSKRADLIVRISRLLREHPDEIAGALGFLAGSGGSVADLEELESWIREHVETEEV